MKLPTTLHQLDKDSLIPLYKQLRDAIGKTLQNGEWDADTPIPSERSLSETLRLSRATVRQALQTLEADGWLVRQQGRGTFPAPAKVEQPLSMVKGGFTNDLRQAGFKTSTKLISGTLEPVYGKAARVLQLGKNAIMVVMLRLRFVSGQPLMLERTHLNYALTPGILEQDLTGSLFEILTQKYGLKFVHGEEIIEAIKAEPWLARLLGIKSGAPILYTQRIISNEKNQVFEYTERFARADKTSFRATLEGDHTKIAYNDEMKVKKPIIKPPIKN
jgi:GntR family transcriptional regulator